jgi:hypothetical protein
VPSWLWRQGGLRVTKAEGNLTTQPRLLAKGPKGKAADVEWPDDLGGEDAEGGDGVFLAIQLASGAVVAAEMISTTRTK